MAVVRVHVNVSPSLPIGLYRVMEGRATRGSIVMACLPDRLGELARQRGYLGRGRCPAGVAAVGKIVLAVPGDTVVFGTSGMAVNGRLAPNTAPRSADRAGRRLELFPFGTIVVRPGTIVLYAPHVLSLDARYHGPVAMSQIRAVVRPLWTLSRTPDGGSYDRGTDRADRRRHPGAARAVIP